MFRLSSRRQGFTLVELLISVVIIGILAAIAVPQISSYRIRVNNSSAITDLRTFKSVLETYYVDNRCYP